MKGQIRVDVFRLPRASSRAGYSSFLSTLLSLLLCAGIFASSCPSIVNAQTGAPSIELMGGGVRVTTPSAPQTVPQRSLDDLITRAIGTACAERERDPQGSAPIDEMQARPSLPLRRAEVLEGVKRAERLLPLAKELAASNIRSLLIAYHVHPPLWQVAMARLQAVQRIRPDMELRDNASVLYRDPQTIRFGTIFLAGLRSDESMISVLAHELTHVADGPRGRLAVLFRRVAQRAGLATGLTDHRAEELTCDLVGALTSRAYITRTPTTEPLARRTARAIEHNCVERDETDLAHLSPRSTMRALLMLNPALAREIVGEAETNTITPSLLVPASRPNTIRPSHTLVRPLLPRTTTPR